MQPLIPINFIKNHSSFHNHSFNHQPKNNISPLESDTNLSLLFDETKNKNRTTREKKREREKEKRLWTKGLFETDYQVLMVSRVERGVQGNREDVERARKYSAIPFISVLMEKGEN